MAGSLQITVEPSTSRFDPLDDRWLGQVRDFTTELDREVGGVSIQAEAVPGTKGFGMETIVLALASSGALTAAVEVFKAWLRRDDSRSLKVSFAAGGDLQSVELSGDDVDDAAVEEIIQAVTARLDPAS